MSPAAVIQVASRTSHPKVAAATVADRLVVAAWRAGRRPVVVVQPQDTPPSPLDAARRLQIPHEEVTGEAPALDGPVLMMDDRLLVDEELLQRLDGRGGTLESLLGPDDRRSVLEVDGAASARVAERALWSRLPGSADGLMDRLVNRPLGRPLARLLGRTPVTPNQVTIAATLIGLTGAAGLAAGTWSAAVVGAGLFVLSALLDCVDGDLARGTLRTSDSGRWLDLLSDQVVHLAVFAGLGVGLFRRDAPGPLLPLTASAVAGAALSFGVVLRASASSERRSPRVARLIEAVANRDFAYLLLILALADHLLWFLWLAAVGSHVFWVAFLLLQGPPTRRGSS